MKASKIYIVTVFFLLSLSIGFAQSPKKQEDTPTKRPTVALVLSGGGAKGFAHIGILEALDELDIPVDYIVGTSMGSIMGGFYAIGYTGQEIAQEVRKQDWSSVFTDQITSRKTPVGIKEELNRYAFSFPIKEGIKLPKGIVRGQKVMNILTKYTIDYHNNRNFSKLPIPFSCVAVDLETGEAVVLEDGSLPKALRASMSIPSIFTPVQINDRFFIDGGVINNFPVDVAKAKGYDYVIGVDVESPLLTREELNSAPNILNQIISFAGKPLSEKNKKLIDVYVHPNLTGYTTSSFSAAEIDSIINRGREAAKQVYPKLLELKKKLGENAHRKKLTAPDFNKKITFKSINISGLTKISPLIFKRKIDISQNDSLSIDELEKKINDVSAIFNLDLLNYRLINDTLDFTAHERPSNRFNVGAHYDSDNNAAILLNMTKYSVLLKHSRASVDAILGKNLQFTTNYTIKFGSIPYLNFILDTKKYPIRFYNKNNKTEEGDFSYIKFDVNAQAILWDSYSGGIGIRKEYVDINNIISSQDVTSTNFYDWYTNYYAFIRLNTLNKPYYPSQGISFSGEVKHVVDGENKPATAIYANMLRPLQINKNITAIWNIYGRVVLDNELGAIYKNLWGGINKTKHLDNEISFMGANWIQGYNNAMIVGRMDLRYEIFANNFIILTGNYGHYSDEPTDFFTEGAKNIIGGGITYSYNSIIGPIEISLMHSNAVKKPLLNVNIGYNF